jgi:hypothetical protein
MLSIDNSNDWFRMQECHDKQFNLTETVTIPVYKIKIAIQRRLRFQKGMVGNKLKPKVKFKEP